MARFAVTPRTVLGPRLDWRAAVRAGTAGAAVFLVLQMVLAWMFLEQVQWEPPRRIAAMLLGRDVLAPPTFEPEIIATALAIHWLLAMLYAHLLAWAIDYIRIGGPRLHGVALLAGAVFGALLYLANFYLFAAAAFPWFAQSRSGITFVNHVVFGLLLAGLYARWRRAAPGSAA